MKINRWYLNKIGVKKKKKKDPNSDLKGDVNIGSKLELVIDFYLSHKNFYEIIVIMFWM